MNQDTELPCVHCGLCLDACPTYRVLGNEADSPRGRLYIMAALRSGELELDDDAALHLDRCLGCLACETACPSGVSYGRHIEEFRPQLRKRAATNQWKAFSERVFNDPDWLRFGLRTARNLDRLGLEGLRRKLPGLGLLPGAAQDPEAGADSPLVRSRVSQPPRARLRAALLGRCGADTIAPSINRAAVEVLQRNGVEVVELPSGCCGALAQHSGDHERAYANVIDNSRLLSKALDSGAIDVVVTTAAGCGAQVADYGRLAAKASSKDKQAAELVAANTRDICEVLVDLEFEHPQLAERDRQQVAYHDACHLLHGCGITTAPRLVVEAATGHAPLDLGENEICCGSAGRYNIDQPELANVLGARKAELTAVAGVSTVAVANVGCLLQFNRAISLAGGKAKAFHPVELLAEAYLRAGPDKA